MDTFDFDAIQYPAFVVVYGPSKQSITKFNRQTYDEQFACDLCRNADAARRLADGYPGGSADLKIYAATKPQTVVQVLSKGVSTEYDAADDL